MFDLKTLAVVRQIKVGPGLDGIMYDEPDDKIILTNHSRPIGTLTALDPKTGDIVATVELEDTAPEGARPMARGTSSSTTKARGTMQGDRRQDMEGDRIVAARAVRGARTGIAYDKASDRNFFRVAAIHPSSWMRARAR